MWGVGLLGLVVRRYASFDAIAACSTPAHSGPVNHPDNQSTCREGLVFKTHRLLYHSTLGLRVIKEKKNHSSMPSSPASRQRERLLYS